MAGNGRKEKKRFRTCCALKSTTAMCTSPVSIARVIPAALQHRTGMIIIIIIVIIILLILIIILFIIIIIIIIIIMTHRTRFGPTPPTRVDQARPVR
jgi:heme/copper-type cytochrome/quinol oxidase subunit 2